MKKIISALTVFMALALVSCGGAKGGDTEDNSGTSQAHIHTFDETTWEYDDNYHWHPATCEHTNQKGSRDRHDLKEDTSAYRAPTCSVPGVKVERCTVCDYRIETILTVPHDLQDFAYTPTEGIVNETIQKCSLDNYYEIKFNAYDANATANVSGDIHSTYVKLSKQVASDGTGTASYIEYKIYAPVALKGRFWIDITGNTSNLYNRASDSGAQSLYYTYDDQTTYINTWKNKVELNGSEVDFEKATYPIDGEDVPFAKLMYSDFGDLSGSTSGATISVPMPEVNLVAGENTLRFTRLTGYAFNMHNFSFKTILE